MSHKGTTCIRKPVIFCNGFILEPVMSSVEVAKKLGITSSAVNLIEKRALKKAEKYLLDRNISKDLLFE